MAAQKRTSVLSLVFEMQWLHAAALLVLLGLCVWASRLEAFGDGALWGLGTRVWFWIAVGVAVAHQVYVWLVWRTELHAGLMSRALGGAAFTLYAAGFSVLGIARVAAVFALAATNRGSVDVAPVVGQILGVVALVPALYLFYSVRRYFSFRRAFGIDHFDPAYRSLPFERRGIFRFTSNGMYVFGFMLLWAPALWWASAAALAAAGFNHLYIWVHYYATERPDMRRIYGGGPTAGA